MRPSIARRMFLKATTLLPVVLSVKSSTAADLVDIPASSINRQAASNHSRIGYKRVIIDFHFSEFPEGVLANVNGKQMVDTIKESGADAVLAYAKDHWGNYYYDTKVGHKHSAVKTDLFGEIISHAKQRDLDVMAYFTIGWDEYSQQRHPEWRMVTAEGKDQRQKTKWTNLCINTGYAQLTIDHMRELCSLYKFRTLFLDIIQYSFDGLQAPCCCQSCQRLWREQGHGSAIPKKFEGETRAEYLDFRDAFLKRYLDDVRSAVKAIQPDVLITHNWGSYWNAADYVPKEAEPWGRDYVLQSYMTKYTRALAKGRDFEMFTARFNQSWDFTIKPLELMRWEVASFVAHNAAVNVIDQPNIDGTLEPKAWSVIREVYKTVDDIAPHLKGTTPFAEVGVLYSHRNWELHHDVGHDLAGACKFLADEHYPYDIVPDEDISPETLKRFKVLVIPNTASLKPEAVDVIRQWCESGGTVLFDYRSATLDENNRPLVKPGIGMVAITEENPRKVSFIKPAFDIENPYIRINENVSIKPLVPTFQTLGFLTRAALEQTDTQWVSHNIQPGRTTQLPAVLLGAYRDGKFIYSTARIFKELLMTDLRAIRQFLRAALARVYTPKVTLEAPRTVEMIPYSTATGYRLFLTNCVTGRPAGACVPTYGTNAAPHLNIDFVLPVHDIQIRLQTKAASARDRHGTALKVVREGTASVITIPKIVQYEVVDIRL